MTVAMPAVDARGLTTIAERTVERLAAQAITEIHNVSGSHRLLGSGVAARVNGDHTSLEVRLSVNYPASVARTTQNARDHLIRRVGELTGLVVSRVDIKVDTLQVATAPSRRVQ
jgi:uncharacterized alkaline shock family protein YloU